MTCSRGISIDQFADVWTKLSAVLKDQPGVLAYDVMNEPNNLTGLNRALRRSQADGGDPPRQRRRWEQFFQAAVDAVRAAGDDHRLMIEGVSWSNVDSSGTCTRRLRSTIHSTRWSTPLTSTSTILVDLSSAAILPNCAIPTGPTGFRRTALLVVDH